MKKIVYATLALTLVLAASCTKDNMSQSQQAFTKMTSPGVVSGSEYTIEYKADSFQASYVSDGTFRLFADDLSEYVELAVKDSFSNTGDRVSASVSWVKGTNQVKKTLNMTLSKVEDDTYWFWDESEQIGVIAIMVE